MIGRTLPPPTWTPSAGLDSVVDVPCAAEPPAPLAPTTVAAWRNVRHMHLLERVAGAFAEAGVPLMVLKGAALQLVLDTDPDARPMADLDLLVHPHHVDRAQQLLEQLGGLRSPSQFREDFFPRYYYEIQYTMGGLRPVTIDLHVRPFRVPRHARLVSDGALWRDAVRIDAGAAPVLVPTAERMLIHLAAHSAVHGNGERRWRDDVRRWVAAHADDLDWDRFLDDVAGWRLALPVASGIAAAEATHGPIVPDDVRRRLERLPAGWRDRLALWHAPRDAEHKVMQVLVQVVTTPGWRFTLGYLGAILVPDRDYMSAWSHRHGGGATWPAMARLRRVLEPIVRRLPRLRLPSRAIELGRSAIHGRGVFARRDVRPGAVIARYRGRRIEREGTYVATHVDADGTERWHEITGLLKFLNHSCRPNAELRGFRLRALRPIARGQEITIDYGEDACDCRSAQWTPEKKEDRS
jgi:hypothetical protein